jgi:O-antigen biosynthesis protein WbqP
MDVIASLLFLIAASPLLLILVILIRLDSKGAVIFRQSRVGKGGKIFRIYKFRTMKIDAPKHIATKDLQDPYKYITRMGMFLRKTSIDELPQLFNVLKGDMSIIGPRPLIEKESKIHLLRYKAGVYDLRPGITGWAQINGRDDIEDEEKVMYDREYAERLSFSFDVKIFFGSIIVVFKRDGYKEGKHR